MSPPTAPVATAPQGDITLQPAHADTYNKKKLYTVNNLINKYMMYVLYTPFLVTWREFRKLKTNVYIHNIVHNSIGNILIEIKLMLTICVSTYKYCLLLSKLNKECFKTVFFLLTFTKPLGPPCPPTRDIWLS